MIRRRTILSTFSGLLLAGAAVAQTAAPKLQFEVATIKPAAPINPAAVAAGKLHMGMSVDGSRVDMGYFALSDMIQAAYKLKQHQVWCPIGRRPSASTSSPRC